MQPIAFRRVLVVVTAGAALALGAGGAQAQSSAITETVNAPERMTIRDIYTHLEKQGFSDFRKIECERRCSRYEVEARNASGRRMELEVDSRTGAILKQERG